MTIRFLLLTLLLLVGWAAPLPAASGDRPLGRDVGQLLVSIAPDWNSNQGKMLGRERDAKGEWKTTFQPVPVLFGRNGLAWGRGLLGTGEPGKAKVERDGRAPAGVFKIGKIYTHDKTLPKGAKYPYRTITTADAWIDDPALPEYNRHIVIDPANPPPWFEKQKMRHNDFAYRWLVEIRHNSDPPVAGMGSAIFFHIRRGKTRPTAGCTTMEEERLASMIRWLKADRNPHYALLPWGEYQKKWKAWGLPSPETIKAIAP